MPKQKRFVYLLYSFGAAVDFDGGVSFTVVTELANKQNIWCNNYEANKHK